VCGEEAAILSLGLDNMWAESNTLKTAVPSWTYPASRRRRVQGDKMISYQYTKTDPVNALTLKVRPVYRMSDN